MYGSVDAIMEVAEERRKLAKALKDLLRLLGKPDEQDDPKLALAIERALEAVKGY